MSRKSLPLRYVQVAALGLAWCIAGCKRAPQPAPEFTLDAAARQYVRLAVALGEHDADSIDYFYGPPAWVADIRKQAPGSTQIRQSSLDLIGDLNRMTLHDQTSETRRRFMAGQLQSIACRASALAGAHTSFDEESRCAFGIVSPASYDEKGLAAIRAKISTLLGPGRGSLAERYATFQSKYVVPGNRVRAVMARAIAGCRAETVKHIALPSDESIEVVFTGNEPWAGYSLYQGHHHSVVTFNTDLPVTLDRALDLACHESYPGHHTFNMTQDDALVRGKGELELTVQPMYSQQSLLSESAAAIAIQMAFPQAERARFERDELAPIAGIDAKDIDRYLKVEQLVEQLHPAIAVIARRYVDGDLEFARATQALEDEALMGGGFETLKYLNEFRSYMVTYTVGPDILNRFLANDEDRWATYRRWMQIEPPPGTTIH
ncbi:hypothetical protein SAMN05421770_1157 [Granulicella rosea]|uniref:DUF885 domain-containing protein n=1 Tax=Granulicella rosea TaxID=474952 RepID=A0A239MK85_9BACT|nr:hypothetical protein [Granulicella rosea]SNT43075.1 hypothetical protein SAMN05421770_1157 [Granulicella rosea]